MSTRSIVLLGLVLIVCMAVIIVSALAREPLAALFGPFRFREFFPMFRFFSPGAFGPPEFFRRSSLVIATGRNIVSAIASYAFLFLAGLLALFAFPRQLRTVRDVYMRSASEQLRMLGVGALSALILVLLAALGVLTFAAFPLLLVLLAALLFVMWGGLAGLALAFGRAINRWAGLKQPSPALDLAFGALVLFTLTRIPLAGAIILALLAMWAVGAVIVTRFGLGGAWSLAAFDQVEESQP